MNGQFCGSKILVKDNFLLDCNFIRKVALEQTYECRNVGNNWRGYRTKNLMLQNDFTVIESSLQIYDLISDFYNVHHLKLRIKTFFHYSLEETKQYCFPSFDVFKMHYDVRGTLYAGIVYLHPNPKPNCGTVLLNQNSGKTLYLENVYNRLVCYPGNILHGPNDLFGETIENGRMTLTFFIGY